MPSSGELSVPTYERWPGFVREYMSLTEEKRTQFMDAVEDMVEDLKAGRPFRPELRVHQVHRVAGVWEMTWAVQWPGDVHVW